MTYTGREYDIESGLYYYRARYYDSSIGRFLQSDPDPGRLTNPLTVMNKYIYVVNNPANFTDPTGMSIFSDILHVIFGFTRVLLDVAVGSFFTLLGALISVIDSDLGSKVIDAGIDLAIGFDDVVYEKSKTIYKSFEEDETIDSGTYDLLYKNGIIVDDKICYRGNCVFIEKNPDGSYNVKARITLKFEIKVLHVQSVPFKRWVSYF